MIKFFHTADIHLGVENYGKINPKTGIHSRLLDFKNSFEQCVNKAIEEKIDFFLFCGDAYKTAYPTPTQQKILMQLFFKLQEAGIPIVVVVGNHDHPLSFGKANSLDVLDDLPLDGFHVFSKPKILNLKTKNGPIQIVGLPWPTRNNITSAQQFHLKSSQEITQYLSQAVGEIIKNLAGQLDKNIPAILAGHLTVSTGVFSGSEKCAVFGNDPIFLPSQLALPQFDYVALGHLHRHQNLNKNGNPAVVYSGSTERIDFGERKEEKGFCRVMINPSIHSPSANSQDDKVTYKFIPLKTRPMIQIEVTLEAGKNQTEQVLQEIEKYDIENAIIKIIYHVPEGKPDKVDLQKIQSQCSKIAYIASITPIRKPTIREKRATLKVDMDINTLLGKYFESKSYDKEKQGTLLKKAEMLYNKEEIK
jgi:DNA repair protein SbcD/Mre11